MLIEKGDCFVVTRGFQFNDSADMLTLFGRTQPSEPSKPRFDRSHEGCVYMALAVAGSVVSCEVLAGHSYRKPGVRFILNTSELEVMTVGKDFLQSLNISMEQVQSK